jgi:hypothetical protein
VWRRPTCWRYCFPDCFPNDSRAVGVFFFFLFIATTTNDVHLHFFTAAATIDLKNNMVTISGLIPQPSSRLKHRDLYDYRTKKCSRLVLARPKVLSLYIFFLIGWLPYCAVHILQGILCGILLSTNCRTVPISCLIKPSLGIILYDYSRCINARAGERLPVGPKHA